MPCLTGVCLWCGSAINITRVIEVVGIPLRQGDGVTNLMTHVNKSRSMQDGFPRDYGFPDLGNFPTPTVSFKQAPWFRLDEVKAAGVEDIEVLGTLKNGVSQAFSLVYTIIIYIYIYIVIYLYTTSLS
jgi:hypothetical protein